MEEDFEGISQFCHCSLLIIKLLMNKENQDEEVETFHLKEELKHHIADNKDILRLAEDTTIGMNERFQVCLEHVCRMKAKQEQTLRDDYTREYIKASNEYTE